MVMVRVMVVEDEPPIMRLISASIEKANSNFKVTQTAMNGKKAIEILKTENIDIVFTDICMPITDGLELAKWINENKPDTIVVMVSGYQDFEYAQKAIEYRVYDYILKPIEPEKITSLLSKIENELTIKSQEKKKELLSNVLTEKISTPFNDSTCAVLLICSGAYSIYGYDALAPSCDFWDDISIEVIMKKTLHSEESYIFFSGNAPSERIIVIDAMHERQLEIIKNIFEIISDSSSIITLVYKLNVKMSKAGNYFPKLRDHLIKLLILDQSQLLCLDEKNESYENIMPPYSKNDLDTLSNAINKNDAQHISLHLKNIFSTMQTYKTTQEYIITFLNIVINTYFLNYRHTTGVTISNIKKDLYTAVGNFLSYDSLTDDITAVLMTINPKDDKNDLSERHTKLVEEVEEYLIKNYNKSITNDVLSKKFGFVPSYISRLFRQQKGLSPGEFLTKYRIELAKDILRDSNDIMIKEVADMVGFKDSYYFSKTFKKETGVWPSKFQ